MNTILLKQYAVIKNLHPEAIILFRMGEFYETFGDDAVLAAAVLGITLTERAGSTTKFAGFHHSKIDEYLPKLMKEGLQVALCEQLAEVTEVIEEPIGISQREIDLFV